MASKAESSRRTLKKALKLLASDYPHDTGQTALASKIKVAQPLISYWLRKSKKGVPPKYWPLIEKATKGEVKFGKPSP